MVVSTSPTVQGAKQRCHRPDTVAITAIIIRRGAGDFAGLFFLPVCDLGVVGVPLIFGLSPGTGSFVGGLLTFTLVSGFQLARRNCGTCHFFSAAFPSQLESMVGGVLSRTSVLNVGLGVGGTTIASGSRVRTSHSWTSRLLTSSISLGVSSLFCRATQCIRGM